MKPNKRILLVDDHEIVRVGIRRLTETEPSYAICGEAGTGREAIRLARSLRPDVVVMDLVLPDISGVEAIREIAAILKGTRILAFTFDAAEDQLRELFESGAHGCVLKRDAATRLMEGLAAVCQGERYLPDRPLRPTQKVSAAAPPVKGGPLARLTPREREVVACLAKGRSNKETAAALGISTKTAETHRARIMRKLPLRTFAELVQLAIRSGLIEP